MVAHLTVDVHLTVDDCIRLGLEHQLHTVQKLVLLMLVFTNIHNLGEKNKIKI